MPPYPLQAEAPGIFSKYCSKSDSNPRGLSAMPTLCQFSVMARTHLQSNKMEVCSSACRQMCCLSDRGQNAQSAEEHSMLCNGVLTGAACGCAMES